MHSPIFLIGTQRSGTTLLCRMLSAHRDIFIKNELPYGSVVQPGLTREEIRENISQQIKARYGQNLDDLMASEGKSVWGLKDPKLTPFLTDLKPFLPEACFILITRDPRAVVNSYMENKWGLGTNAYTGALRWRDEILTQLAFETELPKAVFRIRYEDLVVNQQATLEKVCRFIDAPFDDAMLAYDQQKSFIRGSRENENTARALDESLTRKWKDKLSAHEVAVIDSVCGEVMAKLGYEPATADYYTVPAWMVAFYRVHQAVLGELQIQYRWRIGKWKWRLRRMWSGKSV
jgi:hypothetical protein